MVFRLYSGPQVTETIFYFLNNGQSDLRLNYTHIVLIPKVKKAFSMVQFRPSSLCNVVYKIAAKVLANRLKGIIDDIISVNQSAFVQGHLITDNVLAYLNLIIF